ELSGILTSTRLQLDREMLQLAKALKWIGRMGSGMEIVDVNYANAHGIFVASSPEGNSNAVAEHALGLLLNLSKNITRASAEVKNGIWKREENRGWELEGKTIALIGFGHTGRAFAQKLSVMNMRIKAFDIDTSIVYPDFVEACSSMRHAAEDAHILSFHVTGIKENTHLFDHQLLAAMPRPFVLINTSRGNVLSTSSVEKGLENGQIKSIGLDVWENEPPVFEEAFWQKIVEDKRVLITPHIAGYSEEALKKMSRVLLEKLSGHW